MAELLATPQDLAERLGADISETDPSHRRALEDASAFIRARTTWTFAETEAADVELHGTWKTVMRLPRVPVRSVEEVAIRYEGQTDYLDVTSYTFTRDGKLLSVSGWGGPDALVRVSYTHGTEEVPEDIRAVCLSIAERLLTSADRYSDGQVRDDAANAVMGVTPLEAQVLERWGG